MVGADDRPRRGGGGCVRADNREIDDGEQGGGGRFCRHGAPTTVDKEVFSPWLPWCRCLPNILPHKCIYPIRVRGRENEFAREKWELARG